MKGRTDVPDKESVASFAAHGASMAIFLSAGNLSGVQAELLAGGYAPDTPCAIVYKATWPEEKQIRCTVSTLAEAGANERITKTALILVGGFLEGPYERSRLYDASFTTGYREGNG